jgi:hypothetical protein
MPPATPRVDGLIALTEVQTSINGQPILCAGGGFDGVVLHGAADDPAITWIQFPNGQRDNVIWPKGFGARFTPDLEVIDERGNVVAREGEEPAGGCPMTPGGTRVEC